MNRRGHLGVTAAVAMATVALKGSAWQLTGSVSLLADAFQSCVTLIGAIVLGVGTIARKQPPERHSFGERKVRDFASSFGGGLIVVAGFAILSEAAGRFFNPQPLAALGAGIALTVLSCLLDASLGWRVVKAARNQGVTLRDARATPLFIDVGTTAAVIAGLAAAMLTGWVWIDATVGVAVSLQIVRRGVLLAVRPILA